MKFYTRARKFQHLIGRLPDGTKIPGGPYTVVQVVGAIGVLVVGVKTMSVWGRFGAGMNVGLLLAAVFGALVFLGRIRTGARNPIAILMGGYGAVTAPKSGRFNGQPLASSRPRRLDHKFVVRTGQVPEPQRPSMTHTTPSSPSFDAPEPGESLTPITAALARAAKGKGRLEKEPA